MERSEASDEYKAQLRQVVEHLQKAMNIIVLSGAGMSTAAGIPDFRSPGGLYGTSATLLENFTYLENASKPAEWQKQVLKDNVRNALTYQFFSVNPLPYHEMRRGMIIGLGENQWKCTIGHVFPEILNRNQKLRLLASQNIDGLDHKVISDKNKLYNPHGLMSALVCEPLDDRLCMDITDPIYQRYVELVKSNIKDIYAERRARQGKSSHLWPGPSESTPITMDMFGDLIPAGWDRKKAKEKSEGTYSVKPGTVLFDRSLWQENAAGERCDSFKTLQSCDMLLVMGTSLSGLTIDELAHSMGQIGKPRAVFDMTRAPVESIQARGKWEQSRDSFLQGPIDISMLDILEMMGWLQQILDYLPHLCLGSLRTLKEFFTAKGDEAAIQQINDAIDAEQEREQLFYGDE